MRSAPLDPHDQATAHGISVTVARLRGEEPRNPWAGMESPRVGQPASKPETALAVR